MLLKRDACVHIKTNEGRKALHIAAEKNHTDMIKILLQHGADVNSLCFEGWTPLMDACNAGSVAAIELLMENGAQTDVQSNYNTQGKPTTAFDFLRACDSVTASDKLRLIELPSKSRGLILDYDA